MNARIHCARRAGLQPCVGDCSLQKHCFSMDQQIRDSIRIFFSAGQTREVAPLMHQNGISTRRIKA